jgi:sialate O-acetylesterase
MSLPRNSFFSPTHPASFVLTLCLPVVAMFADVQVASPFGDHMVLQCEMRLPVWGTATPGEVVTVEFGEQKKQTTTSDDGRWHLQLDPVAASTRPGVLTIGGSSMAHPIRYEDVLVGEVWICGGEGNMERQLGLRDGQQPIHHWEKEVASADYPTIRQLHVKQRAASSPQSHADAKWMICSPETVSDFTAVGYFFSRDVQKRIGVPIGIILSSWSATPAEAWTSVQGLAAFPEFSSGQEKTATGSAADSAPSDRNSNKDTPPRSAPSAAYNGMIAPLIPYAIRGVTFYHGESNTDRAAQYRELFPALIADWRSQWGQGDFPFLFVQAAPHRILRPELREAQLLTWQKTANTAMIVTLDCGDIDDLHPPRKQPVGARLALAARALAYKEDVEYSGPVYQSMTVDEHRAILHFTHLGGGLAANDFSLMTFTMAGPDGHFHAAHGEIEGNTIAVSIPDVEKPYAVRYAWETTAEGNVVNDLGLPASPFRTDHP